MRGALATQGPEGAIEVCQVEAPRLAQRSARPDVTLGRTSHRLRNPANAPQAWMLPLLDEYRAGEIDGPRTVDLGPRGTGYVEPIAMQPVCMTCHGDAVDPALLSTIRDRYPEDRAVGFRLGELRGLFWAVVGPTSPSS